MNTVHCTRSVWLIEPASLVTLDRTDGAELANRTSLLAPDADFAHFGWLKLGAVEMTYTFAEDEDHLVGKAAEAIHKKLEEIEAKRDEELSVLREALAKLQAIGYTPQKAPAPSTDFDDDIPF
jgi:hypothetical protein